MYTYFSDNKIKKFLSISQKLLDGIAPFELNLYELCDDSNILMFWKDHVSTYLACNKKFAEISGVTSPQNIIGKNDYELAWRKEQSDKYISDDHAVVSLGCAKLNIIESISQADGKETLNFTSKFPIYSSNKKKQGLFGMITPIEVCTEFWLKGSNLHLN